MKKSILNFSDKKFIAKILNIILYNIKTGNPLTFIFLLFTYLFSCIDPYHPPAIEQNESFLVVDGTLNAGTGSSTIRLSRTQNLSDQTKSLAELKAKVAIQEEEGNTYTLTEVGNGIYAISNINLSNAKKYRLSIKTSFGSQYYSDYVQTQQTPKIDSISWKVENEGVQIYVNTHDASNNTWYYRWEYEETWEFASIFQSYLEYKGGQVVPRLNPQELSRCWKGEKSNNIIIGTSFRQSQDIIQNYRMTFIPGTSPKTNIKYSILVRQYALSKDAYEYWQKLKRNTEGMGTLFDPQPSDVTGNIHSASKPGELVFGYFSASSLETKRIFIKSSQIPPWRHITGYELCKTDTILLSDWPQEYNPTSQLIIEQLMSGPTAGGYTVAPASCVDCRLFGTNVRPDFWQ